MRVPVRSIVGSWLLALAGGLIVTSAARAVDEIQVYNAEIAKAGQWTLQLHLNYALQGRKTPDFPGGLIPHHALNGTPELAYGVTDWWELGLYLPFAIDRDATPYASGIKVRSLFVTPDAEKRTFFYGVNFEFSYSTPRFSETRFNIEIRPIIGVRKDNWEFIVNPIVDLGIGPGGEAVFAPAARIARKFGEDLAFGVEYYSELGAFGNFAPFAQQQHTIFGVVDFKVLNKFDVNFGLGYGLTAGSDRFVAKMIVGTELNDGGAPAGSNPNATGGAMKSVRMMAR